MKKIIKSLLPMFAFSFFVACNNENKGSNTSGDDNTTTTTSGGQETVQDEESQKDIVKIAVGSKDHSTLVAALKQADYVTALSNAGPFTVFAPTNAAFDKLPAGTVDGLMKADKKNDLQNILEYHVSIGVFKENMMQDGQLIDQANNQKITISKSADGKITVNGKANILAAIPASNGLVYVIDEVLLPPAKN
ncbi:MAG TPA: fasciclin domain-containing protein [Chitinophagaceae bacterium]|nr:fasciclin domain-containing protein [Chitinophagaceae bacterium]HRX92693.1 fasciclin domain-containing protein [Chitinophagaceae bacterium]